MNNKLAAFIVSVIIISSSYGQYPVSNNLVPETVFLYKNDTTKVLLLVCDTSIVVNTDVDGVTTTYYSFYINDKHSVKNRMALVYWQFGYEVTRTVLADSKLVGTLIDLHPVYQKIEGYSKQVHTQWLDENKKPILPTTVVWQAKRINNN